MNELMSIKISSGGAIETFPITDAMVDDGIGWDSMGNDAAHDGQGIGHEAGDHTGHGSLLSDGTEGLNAVVVAQHASVAELIASRMGIRRRK
ncbi:hypothetical protein [Novosphingobium sp. M1R2S20]|uniref:Uncharacterized protein n=1 Tax=Novosphingobium rhizovicinum TaxID=3228928 RepID=A0ABV3R7V5_9SPHN